MDLGAFFLVDEVEIPSVVPLKLLILAEVNAVGVWDGKSRVFVAFIEFLRLI